jgi:HlyD family secretion protein
MTRNAQPGSVFNAGATLLTLTRLDELTITVYVPEDRVGEVSLGQAAEVAVDSFPGVTFKATVIYISDQAEFTPRNVQTVAGRKNTVFAVKLTLKDTSGKLKPGMPADVTFLTK